MRGEEENHTGNALEALEPLQLTASLGIAVVNLRSRAGVVLHLAVV
jgi:hypothetical protein